MRRKDKAMQAEAIQRLLQEGEYGVLATVDSQGQPYGVPLNYVYDNDCIYFHCALEGLKLDNLSANGKVSFCIVGYTRVLPRDFNTEFESVVVFGEATVVQGDERHRALVKLVEKYAPAFIEEGHKYIAMKDNRTRVVKIVIHHVTGKAKLSAKM